MKKDSLSNANGNKRVNSQINKEKQGIIELNAQKSNDKNFLDKKSQTVVSANSANEYNFNNQSKENKQENNNKSDKQLKEQPSDTGGNQLLNHSEINTVKCENNDNEIESTKESDDLTVNLNFLLKAF